jgi:Flp pilus assembly pilin Flp
MKRSFPGPFNGVDFNRTGSETMKRMIDSVRRFVRDDSGISAVAEAAILAVGAIVLIAVLGIWNGTVKTEVIRLLQELLQAKG